MKNLQHVDTTLYIEKLKLITKSIITEFTYNSNSGKSSNGEFLFQNFSIITRNPFLISIYQTLEFKLMNVLLLCEYDKGNVTLEIQNDHFSNLDPQLFIFNNSVDSFITVLDLISKIVSWYYDLKNKNKSNFNKNFIKSVRKIENNKIIELINRLEIDESIAKIKDYRHNDKHSNALGKRLESTKNSISMTNKIYNTEVESVKIHINSSLDLIFESIENLTNILLEEGANKANKTDMIGYIKK